MNMNVIAIRLSKNYKQPDVLALPTVHDVLALNICRLVTIRLTRHSDARISSVIPAKAGMTVKGQSQGLPLQNDARWPEYGTGLPNIYAV